MIPQQTLHESTQNLWSYFELHYACLRQSLQMIDGEEKSKVENDWESMAQQWKKQRVELEDRCVLFLEIIKT